MYTSSFRLLDNPIFTRYFWPDYPLKKSYIPRDQKQLREVLQYAWKALLCFFERCKHACLGLSYHRIDWQTNSKLCRQFLHQADQLTIQELAEIRKDPRSIVQTSENKLKDIHVKKVLAQEIETAAKDYVLTTEHYHVKVINDELLIPAPLDYQQEHLLHKWMQLFQEAQVGNVVDDGKIISSDKAKKIFKEKLTCLCSSSPVIVDAYEKENIRDAKKVHILLGHLAHRLQGCSQEEKRSVVEGLVVAFGHCIDRILSELEDIGYRYLQDLFNPEEKNLQQRLMRGLQQLRIQIFGEVCRFTGDSHYASTYRYMLGYFQEQYGIKKIFNDHPSSYECYAAKDRWVEVQSRFLSEYQPARIAACLARIWMAFVTDKEDCFYPVSYQLVFKWFQETYQKEKPDLTSDELSLHAYSKIWVDDDVGERIRAAAIFRFLEEMGICQSVYSKNTHLQNFSASHLKVNQGTPSKIAAYFRKIFT